MQAPPQPGGNRLLFSGRVNGSLMKSRVTWISPLAKTFPKMPSPGWSGNSLNSESQPRAAGAFVPQADSAGGHFQRSQRFLQHDRQHFRLIRNGAQDDRDAVDGLQFGDALAGLFEEAGILNDGGHLRGQRLQQDAMLLIEGVWLVGLGGHHADDLTIFPQRHGQDGTDALFRAKTDAGGARLQVVVDEQRFALADHFSAQPRPARDGPRREGLAAVVKINGLVIAAGLVCQNDDKGLAGHDLEDRLADRLVNGLRIEVRPQNGLAGLVDDALFERVLVRLDE